MPRQGQSNSYQSLTPRLRLDLSNNHLEEVPGELLHMKNLEVLNLRLNKLTGIHPSIGELNNLERLNLASNRFNSFPWELIGLLHGNLRIFETYPNPIFHPLPSIWNYEAGVDSAPCPVASTRIAFLDITGESIHHWPPAPTSLSEHWPEPQADDEFLGPPPEERTKTPSLLELVLRACTMSSNLSQLPLLIPDGPKHLRQLLQKTWTLREAGGQDCSVCGKGYIIPRTEWIEWWYCVPHKQPRLESFWGPFTHRTPVPLLRRGCSWACWAENACPLIRGWHCGTV